MNASYRCPLSILLCAALIAWTRPAARADDSQDARYLGGLRDRRLYELAEKYCQDRLADEGISDTQRADLTIELSRTLAEHALSASASAAPAIWDRAREVPEQFAARRARSPRLLLVQLQGLLVLAAQGEAERQVAQDQRDDDATAKAGALLRKAIAGLEQLNDQISDKLRRQSRTPAARDELSTAELQSLQANVQLELARTLRNQALCYPEGSADRINALTRVGEALGNVMRHNEGSLVTWSAELEDIARLRLLGEYSAAESKLAELDQKRPPAAIAQLVQAERMRLALARGKVDEALAEAGTAASVPRGAEVDFARLETLIAAAQRATQRQQTNDAAQWQNRAVEQAESIGRMYGAHWMRRAESLLARSVSLASGPQTAASLSLAAAGYYRGGQLDKAIATFDEATKLARQGQQAQPAFESAYSAATIEKERGNYRTALDRYRRLAMDSPDNPHAASAHLLAIFCAAQLAQATQPPKLDEYELLLREHLDTFPSSDTASQAYSWLGRLEEHRGDWQAAIRTLEQVRPSDSQYAESIEAIGRCYQQWLSAERLAGRDTRQLADQALSVLEEITGTTVSGRTRPDDATRAAALAAAQIWLLELPNGAVPAERLLRSALESDTPAPLSWQNEARRWLVAAFVLEGKGGQADQLLDAVATSPRETVEVLDVLAKIRAHQQDDAANKLAAFEMAVIDQLLEKPGDLVGDSLRALRRRRAITLADAGNRKAGLEELQNLAREFPRDGQAQEDLARLLGSGNAADMRAAIDKWEEVAHKSRPGTARWFRAYFGLTETQLRLGQNAEARATLQTVSPHVSKVRDPAIKADFERLTGQVR